MKEADWKCASCGEQNIAIRETCTLCGAPKHPPAILEEEISKILRNQQVLDEKLSDIRNKVNFLFAIAVIILFLIVLGFCSTVPS